MTESDAPRPRWRRVLGSFWVQLAIAFTVVALILSFVAKPYVVPSSSMQQTLQPGDRILVNRLAFLGAQPATGDVIVFDADGRWETAPPASADPVRDVLRRLGEVTGFGPSGPHTLVKRVIGAPGQTVSCCSAAGAVVVDGDPLDEPYVTNDFAFERGSLDCTSTPRSQRCFDQVTVPADAYLMLGDNRSDSADSAWACRGHAAGESPDDCWRWASRDGIVGKAVAILWPVGRWRAV